MSADIWFVTGGARSGKSSFAEHLAAGTGRPVVYLATLEPLDAEMRARIERHRKQRPPEWRTVEAPRDLIASFRGVESGACVLLDCLSLWVSNRLLLLGEDPSPVELEALEVELAAEVHDLLDLADTRDGPSIIVSNEVGSGVVPPYPLGRAYRDMLGRVNQLVSRRASRAWLLLAGRAIELPPPWQP
ncbi:MAG: bifunctional adenosylcobinamide kinase/adenosylcobinamide-phosphate guanylyltransferase [Dehalococcoidia bacterium]|nr:bifunctional adenosylcobinamide kinase/adenosylcobinamide-phosphate guanylyltransferase [Dehalococcoidia bacterium]